MSEVLGCGIDIEELIRFDSKVPSGHNLPGFAQLVYSPLEIESYSKIKSEYTFPLSFSCKEAFFKALGVSWTNSYITWKDIELVFHDENNLNDYSIKLSGYAEELFIEKKCRRYQSEFKLTDSYIIFQVVLLS
jgi:phosphopantetheine--protein transferase-like protein